MIYTYIILIRRSVMYYICIWTIASSIIIAERVDRDNYVLVSIIIRDMAF